jgi:hypothetical protein
MGWTTIKFLDKARSLALINPRRSALSETVSAMRSGKASGGRFEFVLDDYCTVSHTPYG